MPRVFSAGTEPQARSVFSQLLLDRDVEMVGEAADWSTALAQVPIRNPQLVLVDWDLLPASPNMAVEELRKACPASLIIVLISRLDIRQQAARSAGADAFISRNEPPERVVEKLRALAASLPTK